MDGGFDDEVGGNRIVHFLLCGRRLARIGERARGAGLSRQRDRVLDLDRPGQIEGDDGYIRIGMHSFHYQAHVLAWVIEKGEWPVLVIHHVDTDRANNRWELYDLLRDPAEKQDLTPAEPGRTEEMGSVIRKWETMAATKEKSPYSAIVLDAASDSTVSGLL